MISVDKLALHITQFERPDFVWVVGCVLELVTSIYYFRVLRYFYR